MIAVFSRAQWEVVVVNSAGALVSWRDVWASESVGRELALVRADRGRDAEDQKGRSVVILVWLQRTRSLTEVVNFMVNRGGARRPPRPVNGEGAAPCSTVCLIQSGVCSFDDRRNHRPHVVSNLVWPSRASRLSLSLRPYSSQPTDRPTDLTLRSKVPPTAYVPHLRVFVDAPASGSSRW